MRGRGRLGMPGQELLRLESLRGVRRRRWQLLRAKSYARLQALRAVAERMRVLQQLRLQVQLVLLQLQHLVVVLLSLLEQLLLQQRLLLKLLLLE